MVRRPSPASLGPKSPRGVTIINPRVLLVTVPGLSTSQRRQETTSEARETCVHRKGSDVVTTIDMCLQI